MKDLRNPLTRTENFEHPSGNIMKELTEAELNSVAAGAGVARNYKYGGNKWLCWG